jgi:enamine deaminase RidA (YjgF/YER057c/UK114 family)
MSDDNILEKLKDLNIALPPVPIAMGNYIPFAIAGNLLFLAGQGPKTADGAWLTGKVGADVTAEEAYDHSRLTGYRLLSVVRSALGSLDRVERVVKILGFVNSEPGFKDHPKVINGCSDLMVQVFGERGRHSRSAVGVNSLPEAITVEIEGIFEVRQN